MSDGGKKAKAAVAEVEATPVVGDFRGIELTLPPKLPGVLALDLAELRACEGEVVEQLGILWRTLKGVLGDDLYKIRDKVQEDNDALEDVGGLIQELVDTITKPYGMSSGESSASVTP